MAMASSSQSAPMQQPQQQQSSPSLQHRQAGAGEPGDMSWDGDKMFNIYVYDYCNKRGYRKTAAELLVEAGLPPDPRPPIDAKQGLLFEWWFVFWELFQAKTNNGGSEDAKTVVQYQGVQSGQAGRPPLPRYANGATLRQGVPGTGPPPGVASTSSSPSVAAATAPTMPNGVGPGHGAAHGGQGPGPGGGAPLGFPQSAAHGPHPQQPPQAGHPQPNGIVTQGAGANPGVNGPVPMPMMQAGRGAPQRPGGPPFQSPTMAHAGAPPMSRMPMGYPPPHMMPMGMHPGMLPNGYVPQPPGSAPGQAQAGPSAGQPGAGGSADSPRYGGAGSRAATPAQTQGQPQPSPSLANRQVSGTPQQTQNSTPPSFSGARGGATGQQGSAAAGSGPGTHGRGAKRNSVSPGDEAETKPDQSSPGRKRPRRSPNMREQTPTAGPSGAQSSASASTSTPAQVQGQTSAGAPPHGAPVSQPPQQGGPPNYGHPPPQGHGPMPPGMPNMPNGMMMRMPGQGPGPGQGQPGVQMNGAFPHPGQQMMGMGPISHLAGMPQQMTSQLQQLQQRNAPMHPASMQHKIETSFGGPDGQRAGQSFNPGGLMQQPNAPGSSRPGAKPGGMPPPPSPATANGVPKGGMQSSQQGVQIKTEGSSQTNAPTPGRTEASPRIQAPTATGQAANMGTAPPTPATASSSAGPSPMMTNAVTNAGNMSRPSTANATVGPQPGAPTGSQQQPQPQPQPSQPQPQSQPQFQSSQDPFFGMMPNGFADDFDSIFDPVSEFQAFFADDIDTQLDLK